LNKTDVAKKLISIGRKIQSRMLILVRKPILTKPYSKLKTFGKINKLEILKRISSPTLLLAM
jgi:hypothetical protein